MGGSSDTTPLREYARQVFGVPFASDAVVTENRLSVDAFLGDGMVKHRFVWRPEWDAAPTDSSYSLHLHNGEQC